VYIAGDETKITVRHADGHVHEIKGHDLNPETGQHILRRDGRIKQLAVTVSQVLEPGELQPQNNGTQTRARVHLC
jgi:hypothetical protein